MTSAPQTDDTHTYVGVAAVTTSELASGLESLVAEAKEQGREIAATKTNAEGVVFAPVVQHLSHTVTVDPANPPAGHIISVIAVIEFRPVFG